MRRWWVRVLCVAMLVCGGLPLFAAPVGAVGRWSTVGSLSTARAYHTATRLPNGKVLVVGGYGNIGYYGNGSLASTEFFDPASGTLDPAAPLGTARYGHSATLLTVGAHAGKVLVAGGRLTSYPGGVETTTYLNTLELYDPVANSWAAAGVLTGTRSWHAAVPISSGPCAGKVLLIAGESTFGGSLASMDRYDPGTGTTTAVAPLQEWRPHPAAVALPDGRVFVMERLNNTERAEIYDPATNTWTQTPKLMGYNQQTVPVVLPNGKVLVALCCAGTADVYDPASNSWSHLPSPPSGYLEPGAAIVLPNLAVVVIGGGHITTRYDLATNTWSKGNETPNWRFAITYTVTALLDGRVLVAGGKIGANGPSTAAVDLYDDSPYNLSLTATAGGTAQPSPAPGPYTGDSTVTLTATAQPGYLFVGWKVDGTLASYVNPYPLHIIAASRSVVATFAPLPNFPDVSPGNPAYQAIIELAARGTIRGYGNGKYGPADTVQRAQMAALIARATTKSATDPSHLLSPPACLIAGTWDCETWTSPFIDRNGLDGNLWRNVETLNHYGVAFGYDPTHFAPTDDVTYAQTVAFVTRAMVAKGYWQWQPDAPLPYAGVPAGHVNDVKTFYYYTSGSGGVPDAPNSSGQWNSAATRGWFARVLWIALSAYYAGDHAP